jgi:hypothetical protein
MFGCSRIEYEVFTLPKTPRETFQAKIKLDTQFLRVNSLTDDQWKLIRKAQGCFSTLYLKCRYGSPQTCILLAFVGKILAHIEWVVPAHRIKSRYPFVSDGSYAIISCLTAQSFRGLGIFSSQIQKVVASNISAETFWIWAASTNIPSLKGIHKAGGVKVGEFIQKKWFWGCFSRIRHFRKGTYTK